MARLIAAKAGRWGNPTTRDLLWQTMTELHFDMYLCGHEHLYARWRPTAAFFADHQWLRRRHAR